MSSDRGSDAVTPDARRTFNEERTDFLPAEQYEKLEMRPPAGTAPNVPEEHRPIRERADGKVIARFSGCAVRYPPEESERLAEWYRAAKEGVSEDDGLDAMSAPRLSEKVPHSIPGYVPGHVGINPLPMKALLQPRYARVLAGMIRSGLKPMHRVEDMSMSFYPWCTIGRLFSSYPPYKEEHYAGTGFMFGGRVMFTARHIFPDNIHDSMAWGRRWSFAPGYDPTSSNPEPFGRAGITAIRGKTDNGAMLWDICSGWDYAACLLDWRIGDLSGCMGVAAYGDSDDYRDMSVHSAGYPQFNGGDPTWELWAEIRDVDGDSWERELETRNFADHGWSGGPLFGYVGFTGDTRVVGVCSGREVLDSLLPPYSQCVWAGGNRLVNLADYTVANWWNW